MAAAKTQLTAEALKAAGPADDVKSAKTGTSSLNRKRGNDHKFYAVKVGKAPEIYHSWADCIDQVRGFPGAVYKSFTSLTEAEAFMKATGTSPPSNATPKKFYAVRSGHVPGVYTDWPEAQKQITGWKQPKHRKFTTRAEAEAFVATGINDGTPSVSSAAPARDTDSPAPAAKRSKTTKSKAAIIDPGPIPLGWEPLLVDAEDGFDRRLIMDPVTGELRYKVEDELSAKKPVSKSEDFAEDLQIWTDGACRGNGKSGAVAGVGVYFGPQHPANTAEPLPGTRQTNQRAELSAIKRALTVAPLHRHVLIHSDSSYSINCVTVWCKNWIKNNWKNSSNKDVENKDLIQEILAKMDERSGGGVRTKFHWVKGHGSDAGNIEADKLAVAGAEEARRIRNAGGVLSDEMEAKEVDVWAR